MHASTGLNVRTSRALAGDSLPQCVVNSHNWSTHNRNSVQTGKLASSRGPMACATLAPIPHVACATGMALILLIWSCSCACWQCNLVAAQTHTAAADNPALQLLSQQRSILATFKQQVTVDPNGALASWTASRDVCDWTGVGCAPAGSGRQVVALKLPGQGLSGTITPLLFNLQSLTHLNLSGNSFEGAFPDARQAGNGSTGASLVSSDLSSNSLSGALPTSIGTLSGLRTLWLQSNDFSGPIPSTLGRCNKLVELKLGVASDGQSRIGLNGTIPDALANCSSLAVLRLSYSALTGPIPEWLGSSVARLRILDLAANQLTGTIPASLGNLTGLSILHLIDNKELQGEVPVQLGSCTKLVSFTVGMSSPDFDGRNGINGTLATLYEKVLKNMTFLENLALSGTQMAGAIPQDFATLRSLVHLELWANLLVGGIPPTLGNLTNVEYVDIRFNDFGGTIPPQFGLCTRLQALYVGASSDLGYTRALDSSSPVPALGTYTSNIGMIGSIPAEIGHLQLLTECSVTLTTIGGKIPDFSNATALTFLDLGKNELEGVIKTEHLPVLIQLLGLAFNRLTGPIPPAISNLSSLLGLLMQYNDIEGSIPHELGLCSKLQILQLGGSSIKSLTSTGRSMITGSIPKELGQLVQLQNFCLRSTQLSGTIPSSFENCTSMTFFQVSDHELSGGLPKCLSNMTSLGLLDFTTNRLDGSLSVVDWSRLQLLTDLYLSRNKFSGYIPTSLGMVRRLEFFLASETNLTGTLPLSLKNNSKLRIVDFQSNGLSGNITDALDILTDTPGGRNIEVIMLSSNMFQGSLPTWISTRFKSLRILLLAGNFIEGSIPYSLSRLPALQQGQDDDPSNVSLRIVNQWTNPIFRVTLKNVTVGLFGITYVLSIIDNSLGGGLPVELSALVGLRYLNLSHNHLSGSIPSTFSNMISLVQLDVSNNYLSGSIPSMLASLSKLDYVDFSSNKLVGRIPFGSRYSSESYLGNVGLCGEILSVLCSTPPSPSPISEGPTPSSSPGTEPLLLWTGFGVGFSISFLITIGLFLYTNRGVYFIFGDTAPPVYIVEHGFFSQPS